MYSTIRQAALVWIGVAALVQGSLIQAEPYLSVRTGLACSACHANTTGGGLRTAFGSAYAQNTLSERPMLETQLDAEIGIAGGLRLGSDARYSARQFELDDSDGNLEFTTDRVSFYGQLQLNRYLDIYLDQQVAPGGSINRESWVRVAGEVWYVKGGKFFLPYGWRLEDDTAFIRQATGINFASPDNGVELGYDSPGLQAQLSVTNGSGGGSERDDGKFFTFRGNWLGSLGQLGLSAGYNNTDGVDRTLLGLFAGFNTGPVSWLLEYDYIEDDEITGDDTEQDLALAEANWLIVRGHNLKLTLEHQRFQGQERDRARVSVVWEYFPWSHTQLRTGVRSRHSDDPTFAEGEEYFVQVHAYF
jgi:hypothetical protein